VLANQSRPDLDAAGIGQRAFVAPHSLPADATVKAYGIGVREDGSADGRNPELIGPKGVPAAFDCGGGQRMTTGQRDALVGVASSSGQFDADQINTLWADPCVTTQQNWVLASSNVRDYGAPIAGSGALPCRDVVNEYENRLIRDDGRLYIVAVWAQEHKTFCHNGQTVTNSSGGDADRATYTGNQTVQGAVLGWSYVGTVGGSEDNRYIEWNGNGKGSHLSGAQVQMEWKPPIAGFVTGGFKWNKDLSIQAYANGTFLCTGGQQCAAVPK
jgi:hypothetical protein